MREVVRGWGKCKKQQIFDKLVFLFMPTPLGIKAGAEEFVALDPEP